MSTPESDSDFHARVARTVGAVPETEVAELRKDNEQLRIWLAFAYAGTALYSDDGELQDSRKHPFIDFKRDSVAKLKAKFTERTARALGCIEPSA